MLVGTKIGPQDTLETTGAKARFADFFEIYGDFDCEYEILKNFDRPIVVHFPHFAKGVNFCNPVRKEQNIKSIQWSVRMADKFNSNKIVIHPELKENDNCTVENLIAFIKQNHDPRLLIENTPYSSHGLRELCSEYDDLKRVIDECNVGFCFDMTHAFTYAVMADIPPKEHLEKLLSLKPSYFHVSDSDIERLRKNDNTGYHLSLFEGNTDLKLIKSMIPKDAMIVLETAQNIEKQQKEAEFLRS